MTLLEGVVGGRPFSNISSALLTPRAPTEVVWCEPADLALGTDLCLRRKAVAPYGSLMKYPETSEMRSTGR